MSRTYRREPRAKREDVGLGFMIRDQRQAARKQLEEARKYYRVALKAAHEAAESLCGGAMEEARIELREAELAVRRAEDELEILL